MNIDAANLNWFQKTKCINISSNDIDMFPQTTISQKSPKNPLICFQKQIL